MADDRAGADDAVMKVNVAGTWNVLLAAEACGAGRVVYASSGKAIGMLERDPPYLPLDDAAPGLPSSTYGLSKWLSEEMCESFSRRTGIRTLCLRPVLVLDEDGWDRFASFDELPPARGKAWHLAVFVDVVDVANAIALAVAVDDPPQHARLLLCADEVASERTTAELVAEKLPNVEWRGAPPQGRAALLDCSAARSIHGWKPAVGWDGRLRHRA
jgi:nucleoside-diphosphate-sugar epimerase